MAVAAAVATIFSILSTTGYALLQVPDDGTCLLQSSLKINSRMKHDAQVKEKEENPLSAFWGRFSIVPPVHLLSKSSTASNRDLQKISTISRPGQWANYYKMAEYNMDEQWSKIWPMINGSDFADVLEVAAGACRNTEKLLPLAGHVLVTDIDPTAVDDCRHRFENRTQLGQKLSYAVVDGVHLPVYDNSVSMVYQFDSGVHFHREVIRDYLKEFARALKPGGTGFFHHSNLGAAPDFKVHDDLDVTRNPAWRSNMTRAIFEELLLEAGLELLCHPVVNWAGQKKIDGIARFRKPGGTTVKKPEFCPEEIDFPRDPRIALTYMLNFLALFCIVFFTLCLLICVLCGLRSCKKSKKRYRNRYPENFSPWRGQ